MGNHVDYAIYMRKDKHKGQPYEFSIQRTDSLALLKMNKTFGIMIPSFD